ncbi:MAG: hypothetical protein CBB66_04410 [bacterium TMED6]|nr:MAG: hypothetical protein CBB66_04410 [bacterium TMED6]
MIILGLGVSRKETKKMHKFFNNQDYFDLDYESDVKNFSWYNSENIVINRIKTLEKKLYTNTNSSKKNFHVTGDIAFYYLPYIELLINNFPYIKFISTKKSKKHIFKDLKADIQTNSSLPARLLLFKKKYKNHWNDHDGKKWEKDYINDKCYPKYDISDLDKSINMYIDSYISEVRKIQRKYPKNLKVFFTDELNSNYGKKKIFNFIGIKKS